MKVQDTIDARVHFTNEVYRILSSLPILQSFDQGDQKMNKTMYRVTLKEWVTITAKDREEALQKGAKKIEQGIGKLSQLFIERSYKVSTQ